MSPVAVNNHPASVTSAMIKQPQAPSVKATQPRGLSVAALLSTASKSRPPSAIRSLFPLEQTPGMLSLLAGKPNPATFPISALTLQLKPVAQDAQSVEVRIDGTDLEQGLQYGAIDGIPKLNEWLVEWQMRIHGRERVRRGEESGGKSAWRITVGTGSQDLLTKTFAALLNPGDSCLVENPAYTGILPALRMLHSNVVPVATDEEGLCPKSLRSILSNWYSSSSTRYLPFPKFIYTTPTGSNPAGTTASEQRKRDVLAVVREFGVLLLEDDPYAFLNFEGLGEDPVTRRRRRSYWSLETEDRDRFGDGFVVRFDSFSKILAAGLRLGFMTGPVALVDAVDQDTSCANLQASGVSQCVAYALLKHWEPTGFLQHLDRVASFYKLRRDNFEAQAQAILRPKDGKAVAEWVTPQAGMFLWLRLLGIEDSFKLITEKAKDAGVLAVPGVAFIPDGSATPYVRASFSIIEGDDVGEALRRLRAVVEAAWKEAEARVATA